MYIFFSDMSNTKKLIKVPEGMYWSLEHEFFDWEKPLGFHELKLIVGKDTYLISEMEDWRAAIPTLEREETFCYYDELISAVFEKLKESGRNTLDIDEIKKEFVERYGEEREW